MTWYSLRRPIQAPISNPVAVQELFASPNVNRIRPLSLPPHIFPIVVEQEFQIVTFTLD